MSLEIRNLTKRFGRKIIFSGFSYSFSDRGIYILKGDSGIGKTTLLRIIAGLDDDYNGEVIGAGIGQVSFAFQEYRLFPNLTAIENVMVASGGGGEDDRCEAESLLTTLGFSPHDMKLFPSALSGGMKQRVSLARAFMKDAPVLLLDEPTKELDSALCEKVCNMIKMSSKERLVIVVTHKTEDVLLLGGEQINL